MDTTGTADLRSAAMTSIFGQHSASAKAHTLLNTLLSNYCIQRRAYHGRRRHRHHITNIVALIAVDGQ